MQPKIRDYLDYDELLAQLAEDAGKVASDALMLRKIFKSDNPPNMGYFAARARLTASLGCFICTFDQLNLLNADEVRDRKMKRLAGWLADLMDQEKKKETQDMIRDLLKENKPCRSDY